MSRLLPIAFIAALLASPAFGWGCEGHQIVALVARAHLTPAVSDAVDSLLRQDPVDPVLARLCNNRPDDPMAEAANWADHVKNSEKTAAWHYIDIPLSVKEATSLNAWCPPIGRSADHKNRPGCITNAIEYELAILRDNSRGPAERAAALRYVIHFVGDIHQPLHESTNNDQGGNCTAMQFFAEPGPASLHAIWDYKLIDHELRKDKLSQSAYAAVLNARFASKYATLSGARADDPVAWSWETHAIAVSDVYADLQPGIPADPPDPKMVCSAEREKIQAMHINIGEAYFEKAMPVIDERLATAGFRLAYLLNDTLRGF